MFIKGNKYERQELIDFIGSKQRQSGIIWNKNGSDTIIVTTGGRHTERIGYKDAINDDGSWIYTGQGEDGDQNPYSFANSLLTNQQKKVLLFSTNEPNTKEVRLRGNRKKLYQYEGIFKVSDWKLETQNSGKRKGDKLVKCLLEPITKEELKYSLEPVALDTIVSEPTDLYDLRKQLIKLNNKANKQKKETPSEYYSRSSKIKEYALLRGEGKCENCNENAPFLNSQEIPFLEVHHIFSLSDGGPDHPLNVAAICPNCHREAHYGINKEILKKKLAEKIEQKEIDLNRNKFFR